VIHSVGLLDSSLFNSQDSTNIIHHVGSKGFSNFSTVAVGANGIGQLVP